MENNHNKIFNSIDKKHQIKINIIEDISWFTIDKIDFESFKTFLLLLKDVMVFMKQNNIKYIKQYIMEEDTFYFKQSEIINLDENIYSVTTNINDFIDEITSVFEIKKI